MKLRHTKHPDVEVDLDGQYPFKGWEVVRSGPPSQPRWQDVTSSCEWRELTDGAVLSHHWEAAKPEIGCDVCVLRCLDYRLRKVHSFLPYPEASDKPHTGFSYFIVERKVQR